MSVLGRLRPRTPVSRDASVPRRTRPETPRSWDSHSLGRTLACWDGGARFETGHQRGKFGSYPTIVIPGSDIRPLFY